MSPEAILLWALCLPLGGALGVSLSGRWPNLREAVTLTTTLCTFGCVVALLQSVLAGQAIEVELLEVFEGLPLIFRLEPLG
ncbi:MAG: cation:proton antiporter, partial [Planctomycetes bacterium]|nr:cation:proton antiporter [Planctomycetota bacterium]